ncbi:MAG TPA: adenylate/guanylate cyclase domain-containing protein [Acidimicrobiia bacterium]|nr:adenylate/guanylate cyclase domain-containing protein [Acidimicrobiia bacterium]
MDLAELQALGLYDPDAPDAEDRRALLALTVEHGATVTEIRDAIRESRLHALAADRLMLLQAPSLTLTELASAARVTPAFATRVWRALGFALPASDAVVCTEAEVATLAFYGGLATRVGDDAAVSLARATGAALARIADADVAMVRSGVEAPLRDAGARDSDIAGQFVEVVSTMLPPLYPMFETVHRRHLVEAARRYSLWGTRATEASTTGAVVGFADLVGYSALNQQLSATELDDLISGFEQRVLDAVARPGARLVKVIGDEAMFATARAADAAAVARELLDGSDTLALRIGIASGTVLAREGDLFGSVVNLAARLEGLAEPGQALTDGGTARHLDPGQTERLGLRAVAGFDDPVEVYAITR